MGLVMAQSINIRLPVLQTMLTLFAIVLVPVTLVCGIRKRRLALRLSRKKAWNVFGFVVLAG